MSQSNNVLRSSRDHARLRVLEDFVLHYAPHVTLSHPAYLDVEPTPLTVYDEGVVLSPRGHERRATRRVQPPRRDDITLQLCHPDAKQPLAVADLSVGGAKVSWAIGRVDIAPGECFAGWIRVLGKPYLRIEAEVVGARPGQFGGLALGLRFRGLDGEGEEWVARLVAACVEIREAMLAA